MELARDEAIEKSSKFLKEFKDVELVAIDTEGYPHILGMDLMQDSDLYTMYFTTDKTTNKVKYYKNNNKAAVACSKGGECISFIGTVEIIDDDKIKYKMWDKVRGQYEIDDSTGKKYLVLKFTSDSMSYYYWGSKGYIKF